MHPIPSTTRLSLIAAALCLVGCSSPTSVQVEASPGFLAAAQSTLEQAQGDPATSQRQRDILARAVEEGELSQSLAREALQNFLVCLDDAGIAYDDRGPVGLLEFSRFDVLVHAGSDPAKADACSRQEYDYVDGLYQTQPAAVAERRAYTEEQIPRLIECLAQHGYDIGPDATFNETMGWVFYADTGEWIRDEPLSLTSSDVRVDCVEQLGLNPEEIMYVER